jgi:hypothetical protein
MVPTRRRFIYDGTLAALGLGAGMSRSKRVHAAGLGPYGEIGAADLNGVRLPEGFTARLIGVTPGSISALSAGPTARPGMTFEVTGPF